MARTMVVWVALTMLVATAGCRICSSPYDYCGPTFTGECGGECCPTARAGSIFSGHMAPFPDDGYLIEDGYYLSEEFSFDDEVHTDIVVEIDAEAIDEISSDRIEVADSGVSEETDSGAIEEIGPAAIEEIDSGVVLSSAEEKIEESPEDELPLLKPPQVAKKVGMLPSDGWKAVKRTKTGRR
jgi:hypothetical protein